MTVTPLVRATASIGRMLVSVAQLMDMHPEVTLTYDFQAKGWCCVDVLPEVWFGQPFFDVAARTRVLPWTEWFPWTVDGEFVRLKTLHGEWIWRLTGETAESENIDGQFLTHRAVWPD